MRVAILLLCTISLISFTSACTGTQTENHIAHSTDLASFLQTVELPKNLSISLDPAEVKSVSSAKTYTVNYLRLEPETVAQKLLNRTIVERRILAQGLQFQTGDEALTEYLTVLDGGKRIGDERESDSDGGFYYGMFSNGKLVANYSPVIANIVGPPDINEQLHRSLLRSDYASRADLSFQSFEQALATVQHHLMAAGIPAIELSETYSLDLNTIQAHYALYMKDIHDQKEHIDWTKNDEAYVFHFRQIIDQIPVIDISWEWGKGAATSAIGSWMPYPTINATYTTQGVTDIHARGIYDKNGAVAGEEQPLISAAQAIQHLIKEYEGLILSEGTDVISAELCYVSIPQNKSYQLIPAWVLIVAKPEIWTQAESNIQTPYYDYSIYVVNAVTGEKMSGMR
ncbi:hypothetical protein [Paenibacillus sp. YYML68]|uniref:hypothetical protein n=1 Tax=Paenibacillus sp. YYML68 TaxID=2909250 RepID=UPI002491B1BE|nr:hypothetical protein [Paenibacillus sp. YYML68]